MIVESSKVVTVHSCRGQCPSEIQAHPDNVYVGRFYRIRSGKFAGQIWRPQGYGNPFKPDPDILHRIAAISDCMDRFETYLARQMRKEPERLVPILQNLIGKRIWCWCCTWDGLSLPRPLCHAAVLADWVNRMLRGEKPWEAILLKMNGAAE